jgi:hypothetical protein
MQHLITIPRSEWSQIKTTLSQLKKFVEQGEVISEEEAAKLLGITEKSLRNRRYEGTIPNDAWQEMIVGQPTYFKNKLIKNEK